jgi:MerR family copper efflux transcriptional regulator
MRTTSAGMRIGELAKRSGVNLETVRYYERRGLLPRPPRTSSGYRSFPADAVRRVRFIRRAQALGFRLAEIEGLLALRVDPQTSCAEVRDQARAKAADIEEKMRLLEGMRRSLERLASTCSGQGSVSACPILESLEAEELGA